MAQVEELERVDDLTVEHLVGVVTELLADLLHEDPVELGRRLLNGGESMPVDSLDMFDILQEFRSRTGLRIPVKKLRTQTLRSVRQFAEFAAKEGTRA